MVYLLAPTSTRDRIALVAAHAYVPGQTAVSGVAALYATTTQLASASAPKSSTRAGASR